MFDDTLDNTPHDVPLEATGVGTHEVTHYGDNREDVYDFDSDGKADVILRNGSTGQDIGWLMNGLTVSNSAFMPTIADTNWEIRGVGDFDGDGKADVILRNKSTGQDIGWLMNGLTVSNSAFISSLPSG